ncbi:MAG: SsrA-binding protein, partial [Chlorobiaceae bacterium]|nr:SsrA-binding protein [Chlorobiaceae bacterium]
IAKGKKLYDKRETIKARENQRQMEQIKKQY